LEDTFAEPLSYSRLATYHDCPQKFELRYIRKLEEPQHWYFSYGKSVHAVLEKLLLCKVREDGLFYPDDEALFPVSLADLLDESWSSRGFTSPVQEQREKRRALRVLSAYMPVFRSTWQQTMYAEHVVTASFRGVPFTGIVDRIDRVSNGTVRVVDYKSGRPRHAVTLSLHRLQVALYASALNQSPEFQGSHFILQTYYLRENLKAELDDGAENCMAQSLVFVERTAKKIASGDFRTRVGAKCFSCDYRGACPVFKGS
jgi:putative RecB family exonuclease